jgi:hypothetical protein
MREIRTYGSERAKAKWLRYSTNFERNPKLHESRNEAHVISHGLKVSQFFGWAA